MTNRNSIISVYVVGSVNLWNVCMWPEKRQRVEPHTNWLPKRRSLMRETDQERKNEWWRINYYWDCTVAVIMYSPAQSTAEFRESPSDRSPRQSFCRRRIEEQEKTLGFKWIAQIGSHQQTNELSVPLNSHSDNSFGNSSTSPERTPWRRAIFQRPPKSVSGLKTPQFSINLEN